MARAICIRTPCSAWRGRYGIPKTYTDFDEMAQDPDIDAVVIGLPNYLHAPVTIAMFEAGKTSSAKSPGAFGRRLQGMMAAARKPTAG